ncbi:MAG: hypothetical protein JWN37_869 [Candidatus Nomurabacteria bacterium]|nr:hypothetical protein [Candidatus Nomurabacteria bacterium]
MKKFVIIYRVPVETMEEWKKNTPPEKMKEQGEKLGADMMAWTEKHKASFVGEGLPLGKNTRVDATGAKPVTNDMNYMCIVQAESAEEVTEMFKENPHFAIPTSFIDIMEVSKGGM